MLYLDRIHLEDLFVELSFFQGPLNGNICFIASMSGIPPVKKEIIKSSRAVCPNLLHSGEPVQVKNVKEPCKTFCLFYDLSSLKIFSIYHNAN